MTDQSDTTIRKVVLNECEQKALAWLLRASDNGAIVSGAAQSDVATLQRVVQRLGRQST